MDGVDIGTQFTARKWYHWYSPHDTAEERKLILKLDLLIVPYAFVLYWVKYIDQSNISESQLPALSQVLSTEDAVEKLLTARMKIMPTSRACLTTLAFTETSSSSSRPSSSSATSWASCRSSTSSLGSPCICLSQPWIWAGESSPSCNIELRATARSWRTASWCPSSR